ncbi:MAG: DNA polymerase IV [Bryobacterales bacterium]|nr:DNA polymerase IV [Bryobacterales bacterium]
MLNAQPERHPARRVIFHVDMDAFFVSVEELYDPSLRGKPVVVGGKANERGVVAAASYAARKFGVHSAMPLRTAYQKCPQAIFLDGHRDRYAKYSARVKAVLRAFSPKVEMASIDEAYLDLTGTERLYGPPFAAAHLLHERMKSETGLNCSIGIGTSRLIAKIGSGVAKPNGVFEVLPGMEAACLAPLRVGKIPGVGKAMQEALANLGVQRVRDLAAVDEQVLERRFGKWGLALAGKAQGSDAGAWFDREVGADESPKSISHEHTFNVDTGDRETIEAVLAMLAQMVGRRLREQDLYARTVQLKLRNSAFETITRSATLPHRTQLDTELFEVGRALLRENWKPGLKVRLIGLQSSSLDPREGQLELLSGESNDRWKQALKAADLIRDRYGDDAVSLAAAMKGRFRQRVHEAMEERKTPRGKASPGGGAPEDS